MYNELKGMSTNNKHKVSCKVWLELHGEPLIGKGGAKILETIKQVESISKTAKKTGMSYRYVWNYLSKLERRLEEPVVTTFKGGTKGGGGAKLTPLGIKLLNEYKQAEINMESNISSQPFVKPVELEYWLKGTIQEITQKNSTATIDFIIDAQTKLKFVLPKKTVEVHNLKKSDLIDITINANNIKIKKENPNKD